MRTRRTKAAAKSNRRARTTNQRPMHAPSSEHVDEQWPFETIDAEPDDDDVTVGSELSFPASDPPAWMGGAATS